MRLKTSLSVVGWLLLVRLVSPFAPLPSSARLASLKDPLHAKANELGAHREAASLPTTTTLTTSTPHLVFPGGGIYFYWQAGVVTYLRSQGYDLHALTATGASAGALTATLALTSVDYAEATTKALDMAETAGVWDRSGGLQGIWGPLIYDWLDELLPQNAVEQVEGKLSLLVTPVPSFGKERIQTFQDRKDLIECNMASVHLPWFLDGQLTRTIRNRPYLDGSFLAQDKDYHPPSTDGSASKTAIVLNHKRDPAYSNSGLGDFVEALSPDGIWGMLENGKRFAAIMEEQGEFNEIPKVKKPNLPKS